MSDQRHDTEEIRARLQWYDERVSQLRSELTQNLAAFGGSIDAALAATEEALRVAGNDTLADRWRDAYRRAMNAIEHHEQRNAEWSTNLDSDEKEQQAKQAGEAQDDVLEDFERISAEVNAFLDQQ